MNLPEGYTGLIAEKLRVEHYQQLSARGFTDIEISQIVNDGLRSVTPRELVDLGYISKEGKPYLDCGGWIYTHKSGFVQFRPDDLEKYSKYLNSTGYKAAIAIPEGAEWVTEGIFDAYFIKFRGGIPCAIAAGVSHYKAAPANSGLNWIFDADGWTNPQVAANLIHGAKHTGGKVQLFPKVTEKGKDGAQEYFESGKTEEDFKKLLEDAYTPEQFCFELPNHWAGLPETKLLECTRSLIKLGLEILDAVQQDSLWTKLGKVTKLGKKKIEAQAKNLFFETPAGQAKLEEIKAAKAAKKCDFLQIKQDIEEACAGELQLNQLKQCLEYKGKEINPGRYKTFVAELINKDVPREDCVEILGMIAEGHAYHPVQEYLDKVYAQYGDSTRHLLDDAANRLLNPKQNLGIYNTYFRKWMIGAVARIYNPGCQFDHVLILQGKQGLFKSTILRTLAGDEFFDDNLGDLANLKDELLILHMAWIQEWAEFDRVTGKREASLIKSIITRREDRFRAPYDRAVMAHKRRSVLCGSVNDNSFLVDDENRRFWVIPLGAPADIETARAERDRLWAAAVSLYRSGELPTLTREETQINAELNKTYQREDVWEELIERWLAVPGNLHTSVSNDGKSYFTMRELLEGIGISGDRQTDKDMKRAKLILTRLGHEPVGKIRLRKGVESILVRAWACSASTQRNGSGTEAEQPISCNNFNNLCSTVPLNSGSTLENCKNQNFSSLSADVEQEKNCENQRPLKQVSGTDSAQRNNLYEAKLSACSASSCTGVPPGSSGTVLIPGDRVRIPAGDGVLERVEGDRVFVRLDRDGEIKEAPIRLMKRLEEAIA